MVGLRNQIGIQRRCEITSVILELRTWVFSPEWFLPSMGKGGAYEPGSTLRTGMQKDYLEGLDNLRRIVTNFELEVDKAKLEFYDCEDNVEDSYEEYLKGCNERLLYCNTQLRKNDEQLEVIDSEVRLVSLLNRMRDLDPEKVEQEAISFLTEFWEHLKDNLDKVKMLSHKFKTSIFKRLRASCMAGHNGHVTLPLTQLYTDDVRDFERQIEEFLQQFEVVFKSFTNGIRQDLLTKSTFTDRILVMCDQKAFPILRIYPDLTEKLVQMCRLSRLWIDRDETFVHDISQHIRDTRTQTRKKALYLRNQKEKQSQKSKSVEEAYSLFKTNKQTLAKIETELKTLEDQTRLYTQEQQYKTEEKKQKEGIVGFLEISITQTKKNTSLQLKRSRIMRQLRELEASLKEIEREILSLDQESDTKSQEKVAVVEKVQESNASYKTLKEDLDKFNGEVKRLQKDVHELTGSLTQLEIVQSCKTSPEAVDDFYERPTSVKLAPSLKEKIALKRRRLMKKPR